jgi:hypothetical protein
LAINKKGEISMKKYFKLIIPIFVIIIVIPLFFVFFFVTKTLRTPVGIIDGIYYDMTPQSLKKVLGEPKSITDNLNRFAETIYNYTVDIDGIPTEMSFAFLHDKKLFSIRASVNADDPNDAGRVFESWQSILYAVYKDETGFYCDEIQKTVNTNYKIKLGTHQGATGVSCTISVEESAVRLSCIYMK